MKRYSEQQEEYDCSWPFSVSSSIPPPEMLKPQLTFVSGVIPKGKKGVQSKASEYAGIKRNESIAARAGMFLAPTVGYTSHFFLFVGTLSQTRRQRGDGADADDRRCIQLERRAFKATSFQDHHRLKTKDRNLLAQSRSID